MKSTSFAKIAVVGLVIGSAVALLYSLEPRSSSDSKNDDGSAADVRQAVGPPPRTKAVRAISQSEPQVPREKLKLDELPRSLRDEVNEKTQVSRDARGKINFLRNEVGQISRNKDGFNPGDLPSIRTRADAFLREHARFLGFSTDELSETGITPGLVSGQAFFNQTHDGLRVVPTGGVSLSFGPNGELIEYSSALVEVSEITNSVVLTAMDAKASLNDPRSEGGSLVLFVDQQGQGKIAYQFQSKGIDVIIDAEDGKTLFKRDRRMF